MLTALENINIDDTVTLYDIKLNNSKSQSEETMENQLREPVVIVGDTYLKEIEMEVNPVCEIDDDDAGQSGKKSAYCSNL